MSSFSRAEGQSGRNDIQIEKSHMIDYDMPPPCSKSWKDKNCANRVDMYRSALSQWEIATMTYCHITKQTAMPSRESKHVGADKLALQIPNRPTPYNQIHKFKIPHSIEHLWRGSEWPREFLACLPGGPRWLRTSQNWFSNEISHSIRASFQAFLNLSAKLPRRLNWDWDWADERSLSFSMMVVDHKSSSIVKQVIVSLIFKNH